MRKAVLWAAGALCAAAVGVSSLAAADGKPASGGWLSGWFGAKDKPAPKPDKPAVANTEPAPVDAASRTARERAKLLRRQAVCNKLTQIAVQTNDAELLRLAEQLDERAYAAYLERTGAPAAGGEEQLDEEAVPDKHRRTEVKPEVKKSGAANAKDPGGRAREVKP